MTKKIEIIERKLILDISQNKVWEALTVPAKLSQWFGQSAEFELEQGSMGWFGWNDYGKFAIRIEQVEPESCFSWRWMSQKDAPFDETLSTLVEWKLTPLTTNKTELYMKESGFNTPASRADNVDGWQQELVHLQTFLSKWFTV